MAESKRAVVRKGDLTEGGIVSKLTLFALPLIAGNIVNQLYNVADTLIVGRFLGSVALAAVGSSYTLMTFLTSILLGLCMGSGAFFSIRYGEKDFSRLRAGIFASFTLIAALTFVINAAVFLWIDPIMRLLSVPVSVYGLMREYLWVIFFGIAATFLYNFFACLLRAVGNSAAPLIFLGISAVLNIVLDLVCVLVFHWGVARAPPATVHTQTPLHSPPPPHATTETPHHHPRSLITTKSPTKTKLPHTCPHPPADTPSPS